MHILFICSGNICRSPIAEGLARRAGTEMGIPLEARSAGILGIVGRAPDTKAITVCREVGVDISAHRSQGVDQDLLDWAEHIVVMEPTHAAHLKEFFQVDPGRLHLLGSFVGVGAIHDPIGGWTSTFRRVRRQIGKGVQALVRSSALPVEAG